MEASTLDSLVADPTEAARRLSKSSDLARVKSALEPHLVFSDDQVLIGEGDSLALLRAIPDQSVSLILTDPPYHTTKKANIYGDTLFSDDHEFLKWMESYVGEWHRILRRNGSIYCFCSSEMSARLELLFSRSFNILSHIVWTKPNDPGFDGWKGKMKKEAMRQWYPHSERILFAEPALEGNLHRSPFGVFLREIRNQARLSAHKLTELIGAHGKINHGGAVSNWEAGRNIPSKDQYDRICDAVIATGRVAFMPTYEEVIRVFRVDSSMEFTDVWTFPSVRPYKGKHPAEKPIDLLQHAIEASSFPEDVVLDCFAGSGSTVLAALNLKRRAVALEIEPCWVKSIVDRVKVVRESKWEGTPARETNKTPARSRTKAAPQMSLFGTRGD